MRPPTGWSGPWRSLWRLWGSGISPSAGELTKKYETAFRTTFSGALAHYENEEPRGECVIVVEGKSLEEIEKEKAAAWEDMTVEEHMDLYLEQGLDRKDAMKQVAKDRGISKRDVYQVLVERKL